MCAGGERRESCDTDLPQAWRAQRKGHPRHVPDSQWIHAPRSFCRIPFAGQDLCSIRGTAHASTGLHTSKIICATPSILNLTNIPVTRSIGTVRMKGSTSSRGKYQELLPIVDIGSTNGRNRHSVFGLENVLSSLSPDVRMSSFHWNESVFSQRTFQHKMIQTSVHHGAKTNASTDVPSVFGGCTSRQYL
jgi:hypothetical protein